MKGMIRKIAVMALSCALLLPSAASAATYYVDSAIGNNTNDGTSTSTPWLNATKINSTTFAAGDQILFNRGQTHAGTISLLDESGTNGNPIIVGAYGTGTAPVILSTGQSRSFDLRNSASYITIQDLELRGASTEDIFLFTGTYTGNTFQRINFASSTRGINIQGGTTVGNVFDDLTFTGGPGSTAAFTHQGTSTNDRFEDITVSNFQYGIRFTSAATSSGMVMDGITVNAPSLQGMNLLRLENATLSDITVSGSGINGIYFANRLKNVSLTDATITNSAARGLRFDGFTEGVTIADTTVTGSGSVGIQFVAAAGPNIHLSNVRSSDNVDHGLLYQGLDSSSTILIEDSTFNSNGTVATSSNGIMYIGAGYATTTNTTANLNTNDGLNIRDSVHTVFDRVTTEENGINGLGSDGDGLSWHDFSTGSVSNSFIKNNKKGGVTNVSTTTVDVYNNVFVHDTTGTVGSVTMSQNASSRVYNNTFYNPSHMGIAIEMASPASNIAMNNIISGFDIGISKLSSASLTEDYNLAYDAGTANWSGAGFTQGAHSLSADPKFVDAGDENFRLLGSSPAINAGTSTPFTTDILGNGQFGSMRDMGAYEYQADPDPAPEPEEESSSSHRSGQSVVRIVSPLADSVVNAAQSQTTALTQLILDNRTLFLSAQEKGIVLPAFVLEVLGIPSGVTFTRSLGLGSTGPDVSALQEILKAKGFYVFPEITGYFGQVTLQAVAGFQASLGLEAVGSVGPATRAALNAL